MYKIISVKSFRQRRIKNSRESGFEGSLFEKRDFMIVHDHDNLLKWSHKLALIILTFRFSNFLDWPGFLAFDDFLWSFYDAEKSFRLWSSIKMSLPTFLSNQAHVRFVRFTDFSKTRFWCHPSSNSRFFIGWTGYSEILILLFIFMIHDDSSRTGGHSISNPVSKDSINATI